MADGSPAASPNSIAADAGEALYSARWFILLGLITAAVMEVLDTTIINVALPQMAGNLSATQDGWSDWYSSREFRDRRTVFFLDHFDGDVTFQYAMRVQIPGEFVVAPARVELMYRPETHANTASQRFSFIDR